MGQPKGAELEGADADYAFVEIKDRKGQDEGNDHYRGQITNVREITNVIVNHQFSVTRYLPSISWFLYN